MLDSYRELNPEQATWLNSNPSIESELLSRLSSGYLYDTFGPGGSNETDAGFLKLFQFTGDISSTSVSKTGDTLRWDVDGTAYVQNNSPTHELSTGDGIITVSSTDGWGGVTTFSLANNPYEGALPSFSAFSALSVIELWGCEFSGTLPSFGDCTSLTIFSASGNLWDGALPSFNTCTALEQLSIQQVPFSGTFPSLSDCLSLTAIYIGGCSFSGEFPSMATNTALATLDAWGNAFNAISVPCFPASDALKAVNFANQGSGNGFSEAEIDALLTDFATNEGEDTAGNLILTLNGSGHDAPSGSGLATITTIESNYTGEGKTATVTTN